MEVTPACYAHLVSPLMSLAEGKIAAFLEGGYNLESLSESAAITLKTFLGDPCPSLEMLDETSERFSILLPGFFICSGLIVLHPNHLGHHAT